MRVFFRVDDDLSREFLYFWGYIVRGFDPRFHCQKCFIGRKIRGVSPRMKPGEVIDVRVREMELVYLCGVCHSYALEFNFHMPGRAVAGAHATRVTPGGVVVEAHNFEPLTIDPEPARLHFPSRSRKFLTCRNFQFAVQHFQTGESSERLLF